ncbi:MAG: 4-(cytidine 5'-diphospho)-2-C-methyl-D-erythritol kinase [Thermodesulfobacteria bacterium]|nr:4-(cytidine 5'-diphospho)-2-C-methyl-D-erythritol kinase [Thermodesulfobacteriota bacterium]
MHWFKSPAKINRCLYITAKLPNGYHEIVTIFEKIAFFDELGLALEDDGKSNTTLICPKWLPNGPDNLAYMAAQKFRQAAGLDFSVRIDMKKRIPAGAGLGGGSSNCGTVLRALNKLTGNPFSDEELGQMASTLGADCPFFTHDWTYALGTGTGTELRPIDLEPNWYLLVFPDFSVSTRWAYQNFKLTRKNEETIFDPRKAETNFGWHNDLEKPVIARYPAISKVKTSLLDAGAREALMSGSGSTVFGVFDTEQQAQGAMEKVTSQTGYRCIVTRTLTDT